MNDDPRVIELIESSNRTIINSKILEAMNEHDEEWPYQGNVFSRITFATVWFGRSKDTISLKKNKFDIGKSKKTFLQYLEKFRDEGDIFLEEVPGDPDLRIVGFNPFKYGRLFPTYEQALAIVS